MTSMVIPVPLRAYIFDAHGPPMKSSPVEFEEDSPFAVQKFINRSIRRDPHDLSFVIQQPPNGVDVNIWKYELIKQFAMELNDLCCEMQDVCTADTCQAMMATEQWIYLCAAHKDPKECCAIDYIRHTLHQTASMLNSKKFFPSRVEVKEAGVTKLDSISRRIYRIFSHTYFHHRELFDKYEAETSLCKRYTSFVLHYKLFKANQLLVKVLPEQKDESDA